MKKKRVSSANVAATGQWTDPDDGVRAPSGTVHAWVPGTNQTVCGAPIAREGLLRFSHVRWADVMPATGRYADEVTLVSPRCSAGTGARRDDKPRTRRDPRP